MKKFNIAVIGTLFILQTAYGQVGTNGEDSSEEGRPVNEYTLTLEQNEITLGGVTAKSMTINGSMPGPVLEFTEGDLAVINLMNLTMKNTATGSFIVTYFTT
jgi:FtsP/CotA-like multicopper oxidase with cupredoxin domain